MTAPKYLRLFLFASLALNIFLLGVGGGRLLSSQKTEARSVESDEPKSRTESSSADKDGDAKDLKRSKKMQHKAMNAHARGPKSGGPRGGGPEVGGPNDLMLLRHMIRIMGGPDDPRIVELRKKRKDDIDTMRARMHDAHEQVQKALTSEPWDEDALREALKSLRKTTFESQAKAQEGILNLSSLMTPEERQKLRKLPRPARGERARQRGGPQPRPGKPDRPASVKPKSSDADSEVLEE